MYAGDLNSDKKLYAKNYKSLKVVQNSSTKMAPDDLSAKSEVKQKRLLIRSNAYLLLASLHPFLRTFLRKHQKLTMYTTSQGWN